MKHIKKGHTVNVTIPSRILSKILDRKIPVSATISLKVDEEKLFITISAFMLSVFKGYIDLKDGYIHIITDRFGKVQKLIGGNGGNIQTIIKKIIKKQKKIIIHERTQQLLFQYIDQLSLNRKKLLAFFIQCDKILKKLEKIDPQSLLIKRMQNLWAISSLREYVKHFIEKIELLLTEIKKIDFNNFVRMLREKKNATLIKLENYCVKQLEKYTHIIDPKDSKENINKIFNFLKIPEKINNLLHNIKTIDPMARAIITYVMNAQEYNIQVKRTIDMILRMIKNIDLTEIDNKKIMQITFNSNIPDAIKNNAYINLEVYYNKDKVNKIILQIGDFKPIIIES